MPEPHFELQARHPQVLHRHAQKETGVSSSVCLEMDLERQEIGNLNELKADPTTRALAQAVAAETGSQEWKQLRNMYWELKRYWTDQSDLEQVEVSSPPDALSGTMVGCSDIFPCARGLEFTHE
jgi:hypothetical protein